MHQGNRLDDVLGQFAAIDPSGVGEFKFSGRLTHDKSGRLSFGAVEPDALGVPLLSTASHTTPQGLVGFTERGGVVLTNLSRESATHSIGGGKVSVRRFEAITAASGVDFNSFQDLTVSSAAAVFGDGLGWAGLTAVTERGHPVVHGVKRVDLEIESRGGPLTAGLTKSRELALDADWRVLPTDSGHEIHTGLYVEVSARRSRPIEQILQPILQIQDLLAVIHRRPVLATNAAIKFRGATENATLWDWRLCEDAAHSGTRQERERRHPRLGIGDLGGPAGVARWVALCERHPRAVSPLRHERIGTGDAMSVLVDTAIAIEYWVNAHARAKWATPPRKKKKDVTKAHLLAAHVGKSFDAFCQGRTVDWAEQYWTTYNLVKHNPSAAVDPRKVHLLALSGLMLLECALLDSCALSRAASRALVADRWGQDLSRAVVAIL